MVILNTYPVATIKNKGASRRKLVFRQLHKSVRFENGMTSKNNRFIIHPNHKEKKIFERKTKCLMFYFVVSSAFLQLATDVTVPA
jgi:hypothetical protein